MKSWIFVFIQSLGVFFSQQTFAQQSLEFYLAQDFVPHEFSIVLAEKGLSDDSLHSFYANREFEPIWYGSIKKIEQLNQAKDLVKAHGLPKSRYDFLSNFTDTTIYDFEIKAMNAFFNLVSDLNSGLLEPTEINKEIIVFPKKLTLEEVFSRLKSKPYSGFSLAKQIYSFAPNDPEYSKLLMELDRLRNLVSGFGWGDPVPEGKFLGYKLDHPNVLKLRTRLFKMGYLAFDSGSTIFDEGIKSSIQLFQADHGLNDDGVAGNHTLQAINISPETRLIQVLVNLERIRWSDDTKSSKYILVNQPNFQAYLFEDDEITWQSRVVIGLPEHQTQEFTDVMTHMIVNPVWHVPRSISITEYLPIIQEDPNFLKDNDMVLLVRGTDAEIDPSLIDMSKFEPNNFPFLIKQKPSNINALGVVKFMFPNEFNIYMHDTPMKELFFKDERTFSHGCVRVQDPFQFAFKLLSTQEEDPEKKFQKVLLSKMESQINLKDVIPVKITYRTVFFGDYGQPQYRADIYGRDAMVFMALQDLHVST